MFLFFLLWVILLNCTFCLIWPLFFSEHSLLFLFIFIFYLCLNLHASTHLPAWTPTFPHSKKNNRYFYFYFFSFCENRKRGNVNAFFLNFDHQYWDLTMLITGSLNHKVGWGTRPGLTPQGTTTGCRLCFQ